MSQMDKNRISSTNDIHSIETSLTVICKRKDGIIEIRFKKDEYDVNVADQLEIHDAYARLTNDGSAPYPLLIIPGLYGGITKEAREMEMFNLPVYRNQKAMALVV